MDPKSSKPIFLSVLISGSAYVHIMFSLVFQYNRTAEREAEMIRPMPILQKTMNYLLNLLNRPYDNRFLGLYNFLWDRMRAIRMDLRMQHIFSLGAIKMLEQMVCHLIVQSNLKAYPVSIVLDAVLEASTM